MAGATLASLSRDALKSASRFPPGVTTGLATDHIRNWVQRKHKSVILTNFYADVRLTHRIQAGLRASGFGLRASGFGLRASGFGLRASGFGLRASGWFAGSAIITGCSHDQFLFSGLCRPGSRGAFACALFQPIALIPLRFGEGFAARLRFHNAIRPNARATLYHWK